MPSFLKRSRYLIIEFTLALVLVLTHGFWPIAAHVGAAQSVSPTVQPNQPVLRAKVASSESSMASIDRGRSAYQNQQIDEAINLWQQAAQQFEQQGDRLHQALTLSYLSLAYQYQGAWPQAEAAIAQSFQQLDQWQTGATTHSNETRIIQGQLFNTQGALQFHQGDLEAALSSWQQASAFYQEADDIQRHTGSLINQARTLQSLGYFLQAREVLNRVESQLDRADPALRALGLQSLGDTLRVVGDLDAAQAALEEGLAIAQSESLPREQAALLRSLGHLAQIQQQPAAALTAYEQASEVATDALQQVKAQVDAFGLLVENKDWDAASALKRSLTSQLQALTPSRESLYAQVDFAHHLLQLQPSEKSDAMATAAKLLAATVEQAEELGDRYAKAYATGYLGHAYEMTQQWAIAQNLTEEALLVAQSLNATDIAYQWQWQLGRILEAQRQFDEATIAYQSAFQSLQSLRYDLAATAPDRQFSFRESVEPVYREYVDLLLRPTTQNEPTRLQQAREVIESLRVAELNNFFQSACIESQTVALDDIDRENAAVVYPIILNSRLEVIVSLPNRPLQQHTVQVSRGEVESTLDELRLALARPFVTAKSKQLSEEVYSWLIRPIEAELRQSEVSTLVFVLDGSLRSVPMSALYSGERYLVEDYSIALTPGLQLITPRSLQQQGVKTIAGGITEARGGFSALQSVGSELAKVEATVPSRVLLNQEFTDEALQEQVEALPYPVVHLATHGQFSSRAEDTFILTWNKRLDVNEISAILQLGSQAREVPIELLILSACETATGDERAELGLAGVAVRAGARSTIASLWNLDDESGAKLIGHLYDELIKENVSKAEALRQAQLALLNDPDYRAPFFWSAFVLVGNWL
ncbi:MAG: CHAT domain-containing protein [Phormidesmis sp.]